MFVRSSLSMEMHQLHQLCCQFIFIKICSDKESLDGFIKVHLFQYCGSICAVPRRHPGNPRFSESTHPQWPLAAIVSYFNTGLVPLLFAAKDQGFVLPVFPYQLLAKWGMGQARRSSFRNKDPAQVIYILINRKLDLRNWQAAAVVPADRGLCGGTTASLESLGHLLRIYIYIYIYIYI